MEGRRRRIVENGDGDAAVVTLPAASRATAVSGVAALAAPTVFHDTE